MAKEDKSTIAKTEL